MSSQASYLQIIAAIVIGKVLYDALLAKSNPKVEIPKEQVENYRLPRQLKSKVNAGMLSGLRTFDSSDFHNRATMPFYR